MYSLQVPSRQQVCFVTTLLHTYSSWTFEQDAENGPTNRVVFGERL